MQEARGQCRGCVIADGRFVVSGGRGGGKPAGVPLRSVEVFTSTASPTTPTTHGSGGGGGVAAALPAGREIADSEILSGGGGGGEMMEPAAPDGFWYPDQHSFLGRCPPVPAH